MMLRYHEHHRSRTLKSELRFINISISFYSGYIADLRHIIILSSMSIIVGKDSHNNSKLRRGGPGFLIEPSIHYSLMVSTYSHY